jgi:hypothetical protein
MSHGDPLAEAPPFEIGARQPRHPFHDQLVVRSKGCRVPRKRGLIARLAFPESEANWGTWALGVFAETSIFAAGASAGVAGVYLAQGRTITEEPAVALGVAFGSIALSIAARVAAVRFASRPRPERA